MQETIAKLAAMVKEIIRSEALIVSYSKFVDNEPVEVTDKLSFSKDSFDDSFNFVKPQYLSVLMNEEGIKHINSLLSHKVEMQIRNEDEIVKEANPFLRIRFNWVKSDF